MPLMANLDITRNVIWILVVCVNAKEGAFALKSLPQKAQRFLSTLSCYSVLSCCTTCPLKREIPTAFFAYFTGGSCI